MFKNLVLKLVFSDIKYISTSSNISQFRKMAINIGDMRKPYKEKSEAFLEEHVPIKEPIHQFKLWFEEVCQAKQVFEPNAVCLATATKDGAPSARMVLLKAYGKEGFSFYTHYDSRKGQQIEENPRAALTFYWDVHERSVSSKSEWVQHQKIKFYNVHTKHATPEDVRVEGKVEKLDFSYADQYFHRRPKSSQIGALCSESKQSSTIAGRHVLIEKEKELSDKYMDCEVPRPPLWGGYLVVPEMVEFWQGQTDRLHDRIRFRKPKPDENIDGVLVRQGEDGWVYERLAP